MSMEPFLFKSNECNSRKLLHKSLSLLFLLQYVHLLNCLNSSFSFPLVTPGHHIVPAGLEESPYRCFLKATTSSSWAATQTETNHFLNSFLLPIILQDMTNSFCTFLHRFQHGHVFHKTDVP